MMALPVIACGEHDIGLRLIAEPRDAAGVYQLGLAIVVLVRDGGDRHEN